MKKIFMLLTGLLLMFTLHATSKGRPVHLGSLKGYVGKPKPNRVPAKELVSLYQEDAVLHVRVVPGLFVIVTNKDEDVIHCGRHICLLILAWIHRRFSYGMDVMLKGNMCIQIPHLQ